MAGTVQQGTPLGGSLESQPTTAPVTAASLPNIAPEPDFIYFHNPSRWDVFERSDGTQELLPILSKLKLSPGVNGVTSSGDATLAKAARMRKGEIEIPRKYGEEDYVQRLQVRNGWLFHERWRKFLRNGSQIVQRIDHDGYLDFLHEVAQTLPAPLPEVLEGRAELYRAKLVRQVEQAGTNPMKVASAEATQARIETIDEFQEALAEGKTVIPPKPGKQTLAQKVKAIAKKAKTSEAPDAEG